MIYVQIMRPFGMGYYPAYDYHYSLLLVNHGNLPGYVGKVIAFNLVCVKTTPQRLFYHLREAASIIQMKNKLEKRLICHRLIRVLAGSPFLLLQEPFKGTARLRGALRSTTSLFIPAVKQTTLETLPLADGCFSSVVAPREEQHAKARLLQHAHSL